MPSLHRPAALCGSVLFLSLCASAARLVPSDISTHTVNAAERVADAAVAAGLMPPAERRRTLALADATPAPGATGRSLKDAISSEVNAIAAASCAMVGPEQCRESQEFVRRMEAFCSQQYGYTR